MRVDDCRLRYRKISLAKIPSKKMSNAKGFFNIVGRNMCYLFGTLKALPIEALRKMLISVFAKVEEFI